MPKCKQTIYNNHISSVVSLCDGNNRKSNQYDQGRIRTSRAEALWGGWGFRGNSKIHLRPQNHAPCESGRRNFIGCISHELASLRKSLVALTTSETPDVRRRVKFIVDNWQVVLSIVNMVNLNNEIVNCQCTLPIVNKIVIRLSIFILLCIFVAPVTLYLKPQNSKFKD
jgi:hypothetical protein